MSFNVGEACVLLPSWCGQWGHDHDGGRTVVWAHLYEINLGEVKGSVGRGFLVVTQDGEDV